VSSRRFDYVTVGHVTVDVLSSDGSRRPGGGAFYSALQAARLGLRTLIVTKGRLAELEELLEPYRNEIKVRVLPAEHTTTLATRWEDGTRKQRLLAWAGAIEETIEVDTAILHLAAVARETPNRWQGSAEFIGVTPQGLLRAWDEDGLISLAPLDPHAIPVHFDALVLSEAELAHSQWLIASQADEGVKSQDTGSARVGNHALVAVTAGAQPTLVYTPDGTVLETSVPAVAEPRDDLGAGDVFAAAFFVALHEAHSPTDAAAYGNAAAAVRVAGTGAQAIGDRAAVAAMLQDAA
jgi:sugar/nucleoside kinase (ribokinase family)